MNRVLLIVVLLIVSCSNNDKVSSLYSKGVEAYHQKHFEEAQRAFQSVIEQDEDFLNAYLMLAKIHYYAKDYKNSLSSINELISRDKDHPGALYWKARILVMSQNETSDEPIDLLNHVLELDSSHIPARLLLSLLYEKKGAYREALHQYTTLLREEENLVSARGNLAILYMRLGMPEKGRNEIDKAVKIAEITGHGRENINLIKSEFDIWEKR